MRALIVRDDRPEAGLGHVMRCRALAEALVEQGCEVVYEYVCDDDAPDVVLSDDYALNEDRIVQARYFQTPLVVIDDFGRDYPGAALVVHPLGEHALIRRTVRDAKLGRYTQRVGDVLDLRTRRDIPPDDVPKAMLEAGRVICGAGLTALEARYLNVLGECHVLADNQKRTADFLNAGGKVDGLGAQRVAKLIMGLVKGDKLNGV